MISSFLEMLPDGKKRPGDEPVSFGEKFKIFCGTHWRGILVFFIPLIASPMVFPNPDKLYMWVAYTLCVMGAFWVSESIPLAITSFFPVVIFPLAGVDNSRSVSKVYMNDSVMMFLGSLFLASSVEQSGLHKRLAYFTIRVIGYSHAKLLLAMCIVTTFVSMWITNTAATVMMVPIIFALLKVFEDQKCMQMYVKNAAGDDVASDMTTCYFCAATFSATVGGIGTLVGTGTNLVFKGLFMEEYKNAPELLSFPKFSQFSVPYMILLEIAVYLYMAFYYLGFGRPNSKTAKGAVITKIAKIEAQRCIERDSKALGSISFWEGMVIILFGGAMVCFFSRSPQVFVGWADALLQFFSITDQKFIRDSALAALVTAMMLLFPSDLSFFKNFSAKYEEDLPKKPVKSVLSWEIMNQKMPYSFMFLLGGGFALSTAAKSSGLNDQLGYMMRSLDKLPNSVCLLFVIVVVVLVTNFASNVAVCNVFAPIAMTMAKEIKQNPLWYNIAAGFSASYCFMLPVGTPGNLVVQSAAKIPTGKMIAAGFGPTVSTILISWPVFVFWAPMVWDLTDWSTWS